MRIAAGRIVLDFYGNDDCAVKHKKLEELANEVKRKFNISILEVDDLNDPERCVIGFSAVLASHVNYLAAESFLEKITSTIDKTSFARVVAEDCEVIEFGEGMNGD